MSGSSALPFSVLISETASAPPSRTMFDGSPEKANSELQNFMAVTPEQMAAVARKYLTSARVNVILDQPWAAAPAAKAQGGGR